MALPAIVLLLWVRSHLANDWVRYGRAADVGSGVKCSYRVELWTRRGVVTVGTSRRPYENNDVVKARLAQNAGLRWDVFQEVLPWEPLRRWGRVPTRWQRMGFDYHREAEDYLQPAYAYESVNVTAPYWAVALVVTIPLSLRLARLLRRHRRMAAGHCPGCGYDVRASPERCPECGEFVPRPAKASKASDSDYSVGNTNGRPPAPEVTRSIATP